jgi:signal peptidase I
VSEERRSFPARIGIVALNLIWPGLGLLRLGLKRNALAVMLSALVVAMTVFGSHAVTPNIAPAGYFGSLLLMLLVFGGALLFSFWRSWRSSRFQQADRSWWARWYSVLALVAAVWTAGLFLPTLGTYRIFYMPSEGMAPTLAVNDKIVASMHGPGTLKRGEIILFWVGKRTYIQRVAALPGDRIAVRDGVVILNGAPVPQTFVRSEAVEQGLFPGSARRSLEQFPEEASPHEIYDDGRSMVDDIAERVIPAGHVFVLGDNRDRSADSRVSRAGFGVELLPVRDIQGKALFHSWGSSGDIGAPLGR